jgi:hypothetical protein
MELYPFIKLKNGADSVGGAWFVVETLAPASVAKQAQSSHHRLFSLFEVYEIEFAKNQRILGLRDSSIKVVVACRKQGKTCNQKNGNSFHMLNIAPIIYPNR